MNHFEYDFVFNFKKSRKNCLIVIKHVNHVPIKIKVENAKEMQSIKYLIYSLSEKKTNPNYGHYCHECKYYFEDERDYNSDCPICHEIMNCSPSDNIRYDLKVMLSIYKRPKELVTDQTNPLLIELQSILQDCQQYHIKVQYI